MTQEAIMRHIHRAEQVLSTPGVTALDWDAYTPGEDGAKHLAYLQRIAEREGFSLQIPRELIR